MKRLGTMVLFGALFLGTAVNASEVVKEKHIIPAPAPYREPMAAVTPDGSFNIRDAAAPFHSVKLADALMLDSEGRLADGTYLDLNHAIYTAYKSADATPPDTILILMPGTWAGAMSMNAYANDLIRLADRSGVNGLQVWSVDRRSEQLEDHTGLLWANENLGKLNTSELLQGLMDYYRQSFEPEGERKELMGRLFTPLDQDAVRFMANWGADTTVRDWRAVVLAAHRAVGNEVIEKSGEEAMVVKKPGKRVLIGGHSLGGSLTVIYAAYDFDRRPGRELIGASDVDGLVLLEGGGFSKKELTVTDANSYQQSLAGKFKDGKVYFDLDILGIQYAPSTMLSLALSGWAADNARGQESVFPEYSRPKLVRLPRITNEALLAFAMDDEFSPFFIARASVGYPAGELGKQFRRATGLPLDPHKCPLLTPFRYGSRPMDPEFVYDWVNIDQNPKNFYCGKTLHPACARECGEGPEVTDFYAFANAAYDGPGYFIEKPALSLGPNDFAEWYFPPRLSTDAGKLGSKILEKDGTEVFSAAAVSGISLPVIAFYGNDSAGAFSVPKISERYFPKAVAQNPATSVHLILGYTHLDIVGATRNNQPDLKPEFEKFNASAVYTWQFLARIWGQSRVTVPRSSMADGLFEGPKEARE